MRPIPPAGSKKTVPAKEAAPPSVVREQFRKLAHGTAEIVASPGAFLAAAVAIVVWSATGPLFHFSDTWQLIINTGTTIITFLMVFLIQNTQARDTKAIQLKLDELLRSIKAARTELVSLEDLSDEELETLRAEFSKLAATSNKSKPAT
jgi:low affinity Fe/Cu permease